jgi:hypothetical protein
METFPASAGELTSAQERWQYHHKRCDQCKRVDDKVINTLAYACLTGVRLVKEMLRELEDADRRATKREKRQEG